MQNSAVIIKKSRKVEDYFAEKFNKSGTDEENNTGVENRNNANISNRVESPDTIQKIVIGVRGTGTKGTRGGNREKSDLTRSLTLSTVQNFT